MAWACSARPPHTESPDDLGNTIPTTRAKPTQHTKLCSHHYSVMWILILRSVTWQDFESNPKNPVGLKDIFRWSRLLEKKRGEGGGEEERKICY